MRILIFSELLYPHGGGAELATWLYAKMLAEKGFELSIITSKFPNEQSFETIGERIKIYRFPIRALSGTRYYTLANIGILTSNFVTKLIKWSDIVYIPGVWYSAIPFAKTHKKPVIVHLHNYSIICPTSLMYNFAKQNVGPCSLKSFMLHEYIEKRRSLPSVIASCFMNEFFGKHFNQLGKIADILICVSKRQAELIINNAPEVAEKIRVCYNPLPYITSCKKELDKPIFLYLGGDSYVKGFHVFLNASYTFLKQGNKAKFVLTQNFSLQTKAVLKKLSNIFKDTYYLVGRIKHEEVLDLHSKAYALIFPSIYEEPLPYAVIEAMLLGTIPIASKIGGVPEIVQGTFAEKMLFQPGNYEELAERIEFLSSFSAEQIKDIIQELRGSLIKKFDPENTLVKIVECLNSGKKNQ
ncbi:MAG: glycosyltransferase family 4 protein [Candidatus Anstonellales archaeon]